MGNTVSTVTEEYPSTWDDPKTKEWKEEARSTQQNFYLSFEGKQWDVYDESEYDLLRVKICFALFGVPNDVNNNTADLEKLYDSKQRDFANMIREAIVYVHKSYSDLPKLNTGIIFVCCLVSQKNIFHPIFRVRINKSEKCYFVDLQCRVYKTWKDWEDNNVLPMMKYCYPTYGFYTCSGDSTYKFNEKSEVNLTFGTSPSCNAITRTGKVLDIGAGAAGLATGIIGASALFTPLAPGVLVYAGVVGTTSAIYGAGRSINRLIDKGTHDQSLLNLESIMCGLSIVALPLHAWMNSVNSTLVIGAQTGRNFTSLHRVAATVLNFTTFAVDSSTLVLGFVNLYNKVEEGNLEALDILQFSLSVFFFSHTLIQPKTANGIIVKAQQDYFQEYKSNMTNTKAQKAFDKFIKRNHKSAESGAKVTRTINKINNPNQFFKKVGLTKSVRVSGRNGNYVTINSKLNINPNRFNQLSKTRAKELLNITRKYKDTNPAEYKRQCNLFMKEERIALNTRRNETVQKIAEVFGTDTKNLKKIKINDKELFAKMTGSDIDRLQKVFGDTARNCKDIISAAIVAACELDCHNIHDLSACVELIALESRGKSRSEYNAFLTDIQNNPEVMERFKNNVTSDCNIAEGILKGTNLKFSNKMAAVYHYRKHGSEFGSKVTMDVYLDDIPKELFQEKYLFKDVYNQSGQFRIQTYANSDNFQFGVLRVAKDGTQTVATMFTNEKFFQNWETKWTNAQEYLQLYTAQYNRFTVPTTSYFNIFAQNVFQNSGMVINQVHLHNRSNVQNLDMFDGNGDDIEKLRELGNILANLTSDLGSD